jgi:predicted small lipoprotein YifL
MSLPLRLIGRPLLLVCLVAALGGCGRRGPLEAPLTSAELAAQQQRAQKGQQAKAVQANDDDDDEDADVQPNIVPTPPPPRRRARGYTVPKEPFILDPLL